jgi:hypothetical protein
MDPGTFTVPAWKEFFDSDESDISSDSDSENLVPKPKKKTKEEDHTSSQTRKLSLGTLRAKLGVEAGEMLAGEEEPPPTANPFLMVMIPICYLCIVIGILELIVCGQLDNRIRKMAGGGEPNALPSIVLYAHAILRILVYLLPVINPNSPDLLDQTPSALQGATLPEQCCYCGPTLSCCLWPTRLSIFTMLSAVLAIIDIALAATADLFMKFCVLSTCGVDNPWFNEEQTAALALRVTCGITIALAWAAISLSRIIGRIIVKMKRIQVSAGEDRESREREVQEAIAADEKESSIRAYQARMAALREVSYG